MVCFHVESPLEKTIEVIELQSNTQFNIEYGGERKKSLVREAILKFSEKIPKIETVPKTKAPKSEVKTQGVAPEEELIQIVNYQETKPKLTQPKPNPCTPPIPKPLVKNDPVRMAQPQKMARPPHHLPKSPFPINQLKPGRIEPNQFDSEQETNPKGNQPKEEINQERGKKVVKEGGSPRNHRNHTRKQQTKPGQGNQTKRERIF